MNEGTTHKFPSQCWRELRHKVMDPQFTVKNFLDYVFDVLCKYSFSDNIATHKEKLEKAMVQMQFRLCNAIDGDGIVTLDIAFSGTLY